VGGRVGSGWLGGCVVAINPRGAEVKEARREGLGGKIVEVAVQAGKSDCSLKIEGGES
jgi:hypothetical protein